MNVSRGSAIEIGKQVDPLLRRNLTRAIDYPREQRQRAVAIVQDALAIRGQSVIDAVLALPEIVAALGEGGDGK